MWTMLWCLTDSGWALSPALGERMSFSFTWSACGFQSGQENNSYSVEEVSCSCGASACMSLFSPHTPSWSDAVWPFSCPRDQTNIGTLRAPSSQEWLPQTWCWAMQTCSFGVTPCWCLPTICFTEISMAMFALYQSQWRNSFEYLN